MIVSLNEIETVLRKAALGAGWPMGLAEDTGRAAAWLAQCGFDGVGAATAALQAGLTPALPERTGNDWAFAETRAAAVGISAFDLLAAGEGTVRVLLGRTDQPLLLIGLAAVAAEAYGGCYDLAFPGGGRAEVSAEAAVLSGPLPDSDADVVATRGARALGAPAPPSASVGGVEVDDGLWRTALSMAAHSTVPSSETSRAQGAGAGLVDSD